MQVLPHHISLAILCQIYACKMSGHPPFATFLLRELDPPDRPPKKRPYHPTYKEFQENVEKIQDDGPCIRLLFQKKFSSLLQSPDKLQCFVTDLGKHVSWETKTQLEEKVRCPEINGLSLIGIFIRKIRHTWMEMPFSELSRLYKRCQQYASPQKEGEDEKTKLEPCHYQPLGTASRASSLEIEVLGEEALKKWVQSQAKALTEPGVVQFESQEDMLRMWSMCEKLATKVPELVGLHQFSYINALKRREFKKAIESLHQYFNYTAPMPVPEKVTRQSRSQKKEEEKAKQVSDGTRRRTQHSLFLAALLYQDFGHKDTALNIIQQATTVAQSGNDTEFLIRAVALVAELLEDRVKPASIRHLLENCLAKDAPSDVQAAAHIALARFHSYHLPENCAHPGQTVVNHLEQARGIGNLGEHCRALIMAGAIWYQFGQAPLARLYFRRLLYGLAVFRNLGVQTIMTASALVQLARVVRYEHSVALQEFIPLLFNPLVAEAQGKADESVLDLPVCIQERLLSLKAHWALRQCNPEEMRSALQDLSDVAPDPNKSFEIWLDCELYRARIKHRLGGFHKAFELGEELLNTCRRRNNDAVSIPVLLFLAEIYESTGSPLNALGYVKRTLTLSETIGADLYKAKANMTLAKVHLQLNQPAQALNAIQGDTLHSLLTCSSHGDLVVEAYILISQAETDLGELRRAVRALHRARAWSQRLGIIGHVFPSSSKHKLETKGESKSSPSAWIPAERQVDFETRKTYLVKIHYQLAVLYDRLGDEKNREIAAKALYTHQHRRETEEASMTKEPSSFSTPSKPSENISFFGESQNVRRKL